MKLPLSFINQTFAVANFSFMTYNQCPIFTLDNNHLFILLNDTTSSPLLVIYNTCKYFNLINHIESNKYNSLLISISIPPDIDASLIKSILVQTISEDLIIV